ncbi:MAG: hypothetical protein AAB840_00175 [Patescibacteria group bacterium]
MGIRKKSEIAEASIRDARLSIKRRKTLMTYSEFISLIAEKSGVREGLVRANVVFDKKPLSEEFFHLFRKKQNLEKGVCYIRNPERFLVGDDDTKFPDINADGLGDNCGGAPRL